MAAEPPSEPAEPPASPRRAQWAEMGEAGSAAPKVRMMNDDEAGSAAVASFSPTELGAGASGSVSFSARGDGRLSTSPPIAPSSARKSVGRPNRTRKTLTVGAARAILEETAASSIDASDAAGKVLAFWFEELSPDDWFRQAYELEERVRKDFAGLHGRAAAGELSGWMSRPDTCLALVVVLDQFTRMLFRGTPAVIACDVLARQAANVAVGRGDDKSYWTKGPHRSALYLPFIRSDETADKKRAFALMEEAISYNTGMRRKSGYTGATQKGWQKSASQASTAVRERMSVHHRKNQADESSGESSSEDDDDARPQKTKPREGGQANRRNSQQGRRPAAKKPDARKRAVVREDSSDEESSGDSSSEDGKPLGAQASSPQGGRGAAVPGSGYSIARAEELPLLPLLTLNHQHAPHFRKMKMDAQTRQSYQRDLQEVSRTQRVQCKVCAMVHELKMGPGHHHGHHHSHSHRAEHQH